jgi:hypothetical protein
MKWIIIEMVLSSQSKPLLDCHELDFKVFAITATQIGQLTGIQACDFSLQLPWL